MSEMAPQPVVRLRDGAVRGKAAGVAFLGIPYAAPPFGANRMRPPQPPRRGTGSATRRRSGRRCPRATTRRSTRTLFPEVVIPGEECLNLNVWTPDPGAAGLPVLVWIHGGSFMNGSWSVGAYDGAAFARDGVVCVTINYRLAAEGFLFLGDGVANLGAARPAGGAAVGAGQHRGVRRRPGAGHRRGRVGRGDERDHAAVDAARRGPVRAGHRAERGGAPHARRGGGAQGRRVPRRRARRAGGPGVGQGGAAGQARAGRVRPGGRGADGPRPGPVGTAGAEPAAVRARRRRGRSCPPRRWPPWRRARAAGCRC